MKLELEFSEQFLKETVEIAQKLNYGPIQHAAIILNSTRNNGGRLFILGVGGSAANASHAVNDFRKIAGIEAYAPTDNVSELTARTNDEGWPTVFVEWLKESKLTIYDTVLILSVGGGDEEKNVSPNLVKAIQYANERKAYVIGIVGRDGGYTAKHSDACVIIPTVNPAHVTPHTEAWQAIVWHLLVSHPLLKRAETKWESTQVSDEPAHGSGPIAVFLDRDGTLIDKNLIVAKDAVHSLERLKGAGFNLVMVTNQPDIARGKITVDFINTINGTLQRQLSLDAVYVCPQDDSNECSCRKPKTGMLREAARELGINLKKSYMVGDTWRDMHAGVSAGCKTVKIFNPEGLASFWDPNKTVGSLTEAADWILEDSRER
jgi:D-sedoheptulose 7-phosphate isomerase